jgi:hypothetical protein
MSREKQEKPSSMAARDTRGKKNSLSDPTPTPGLGLGWGSPHCQLQGTSKDIYQSLGWWASPPTTNTSDAWAGMGCWMPGSQPGPEVRAQKSGSPRGQRPKVQTPKSGRAVGIGLGEDNRGKARAPRRQNQVL